MKSNDILFCYNEFLEKRYLASMKTLYDNVYKFEPYLGNQPSLFYPNMLVFDLNHLFAKNKVSLKGSFIELLEYAKLFAKPFQQWHDLNAVNQKDRIHNLLRFYYYNVYDSFIPPIFGNFKKQYDYQFGDFYKHFFDKIEP